MAAISMTLCELSTANHHSPPLECVAFSTESRSSRPPAHGPAHRSCVEALSRSAQYWSSYSGYLREVSQLCYAFRRWNDIDTARDIYRNATLEKVTLLQYLNDRELKLRQAEEISQLLLRDILDGVSNFRSSATDTQSAIQDLVRKVSAGFDQGALALADAISLLLAHAEHNQMEAILRHSTSLDLVSTSTQRSFHDHVEGIFAISRRYFADIGDVAGEIYMRLSVVGGELGDMHQAGHNLPYSAPFSFSHGTQSVSQLATSLSALGSQVDSNLAQAQDTHALQVESSEAALDLANSLAELSAAAHHEMQNISGTAEGIRESMLDAAAEALGPDWLAWGRAFALWVCGVILRVDPSSLEHVAALPMVRALIAATRVASWCVRAAASSSVSVLLLVLSARRWLGSLPMLASSQDPERYVPSCRTTALNRRPLDLVTATMRLLRSLGPSVAHGRSPLSAGLSSSAIGPTVLSRRQFLQSQQDVTALESRASQTDCATPPPLDRNICPELASNLD
ncbi:uncharacterized protein C8Q71DRAFT_848869, partial [Rhodofomes roseus]